MAAEGEERRHRHDQMAWVAWHAAALQRAKKMPALRELLSGKADKASVDARLKATMKAAFPIRRKQKG